MASIALTDEIYDSETITFDDCVFENNTGNYASTVWLEEVSMSVSNSLFAHNNATTFGAVIASTSDLCYDDVDDQPSDDFPFISVVSCEFRGNKAPNTGVIGVNYYQLSVEDSLFENNIREMRSGSILSHHSCTSVKNSIFDSNVAG